VRGKQYISPARRGLSGRCDRLESDPDRLLEMEGTHSLQVVITKVLGILGTDE
jgi:hypothetical protein